MPSTIERVEGCNVILRKRSLICKLREFVCAHRWPLATALIVLSSLFWASELTSPLQEDIKLYQEVAQDFLGGVMPYRDRLLEYPPYSVCVFLLPQALSVGDYLGCFMAIATASDLAIKLILLFAAFRQPTALHQWIPILCYTLATPFIHYFFLQRYDLFPALACVISLYCFCAGRPGLSGFALACGIGLKLYPAVFALPMMLFAWNKRRAVAFCLGLSFGLLPIALMSFFLPWWRFAEFHAERGIQVESVYGSVLWFCKLLFQIHLAWVPGKAIEVRGPVASLLLPWFRALWVLVVIASCGVASRAAIRQRQISINRLSRLVLFPLLSFVAFNQVLSPQYLIWLLPVAALASLEDGIWPALTIAIAMALTPCFYPRSDYFSGLKMFGTVVLLCRNALLLLVWGILFWETLRISKTSKIRRFLFCMEEKV